MQDVNSATKNRMIFKSWDNQGQPHEQQTQKIIDY